MTRLACIIGWPVEHSLSPVIHNSAFRALGLDWSYVALGVRPGGEREGVQLLRALGVDGANVTMPHKRAVVPLLDELEHDAAAVGAVNTILRRGDRLVGENTDGSGFVRFLRRDADFEPAGRRCLLLGAGGAARAVAVALAGEGATVTVAARRVESAAEVASLAPGIRAADWSRFEEAELVVNATPERSLPLERLPIGAASLVTDLIYPPPPTPLLDAARAARVAAFDGLGMLIHQAALAFELWTGHAAPVEVMSEAARAALT